MRVGVIGAGAIGRTHLDTIAATEGFEVAGLADPMDAAAAVARAAGTRHYRDHRELFAAERPDAVIVATPNELHVPQGRDAVAAGIPALIEKPIAGDYASALELVAESEDLGVPVLVGHHRRYHPVTVRAKEIIDSGRLGRIAAVGVTSFVRKPDDYFDIAWHRAPGSGGSFLINLIHEIDLLRHLVGEIVAVSALASSAVRGLDVEDSGAVTLAFEGGAVGSIVISDAVSAPWSWDLTAGDSPRFPAHEVDAIRIGGVAASLAIPTLDVWSHEGAQTWTTPLVAERAPRGTESPYVQQLRHLGDVAAGRAIPLVSAREGARNLAILEAVATAAATGSTVRV